MFLDAAALCFVNALVYGFEVDLSVYTAFFSVGYLVSTVNSRVNSLAQLNSLTEA